MLSRHASHPRQTLTAAFAAWKALLLVIALGSAVAPSYDTSTTLMLHRNQSDSSLVTRLTRWDAIYFTQSARRGYVYEQEWAFSLGFPVVVSGLATVFKLLGLESDGNGSLEAALGIVVAHAAHLFAVLTLYELTLKVFGRKPLAFLAALLHILSPAGLFLSAPYAESSFAFLSFAGFLIIASASDEKRGSLRWNALQVLAGLVFGLATAFRSNGLLNGLYFATECFLTLYQLLASPITSASVKTALVALPGPGFGGLLVAMGSVIPQALAWLRYCSGASEARLWCTRTVPSIYSFVQEHYWGVGLFRYWTPSNIPLFALAAPVLGLLMASGFEMLKRPSGLDRSPMTTETGGSKSQRDGGVTPTSREIIVFAMAASQILLAGMAITTYHVQIITRISSGYAVWYWWVASLLLDDSEEKNGFGRKVVSFAVMYATIQGALFASFLPPA